MGKILSNKKFVKVLDELSLGKTTQEIVKAAEVSSQTVWKLANELPLWKYARDVAKKLEA